MVYLPGVIRVSYAAGRMPCPPRNRGFTRAAATTNTAVMISPHCRPRRLTSFLIRTPAGEQALILLRCTGDKALNKALLAHFMRYTLGHSAGFYVRRLLVVPVISIIWRFAKRQGVFGAGSYSGRGGERRWQFIRLSASMNMAAIYR